VNTAGGIMTNDMLTVRAGLTISEARESVRERSGKADFVYFVYVESDDDERRLVGVLTLRQLLVTAGDRTVDDVMNPFVVRLEALEPSTAAAYRVIESHLAALPVVDRHGRLLGVVTVDAALAAVAPRSFGGTTPRVFS
jgi:magnesium transporter